LTSGKKLRAQIQSLLAPGENSAKVWFADFLARGCYTNGKISAAFSHVQGFECSQFMHQENITEKYEFIYLLASSSCTVD
jgi:hypothetical protein